MYSFSISKNDYYKSYNNTKLALRGLIDQYDLTIAQIRISVNWDDMDGLQPGKKQNRWRLRCTEIEGLVFDYLLIILEKIQKLPAEPKAYAIMLLYHYYSIECKLCMDPQ